MEINRLTSTAALISAIRRDIAAKTGLTAAPTRADRTPEAAAGQSSGPSVAVLRRQLIDIAREVDAADPIALRQARTRFIRTVLVWEFGPELREHPQWRSLMDGIDAALDARGATGDAEFATLLKNLK